MLTISTVYAIDRFSGCLPITGAGFGGVEVGATGVDGAHEVDQLAVVEVKGIVVFFCLIVVKSCIGVVKFTNSSSVTRRKCPYKPASTMLHMLIGKNFQ